MQSQPSKIVFRAEKCREFGRLSRDLNPLHVDELYARRSMAGSCAVHGVFLLLRALEAAFGSGVPKPTRITAKFRKFVCVGEEADFAVHHKEGGGPVEIKVSVAGAPRAEIVLEFDAPVRGELRPAARGEDVRPLAFLDEPLDEPPSGHLGCEYELDLSGYSAMREFPRCSSELGEMPTRALCAATYFVGMVCPGLNSIFSGLSVELADARAEASTQKFRLARFDERIGRFEIVSDGALKGTITAFSRPRVVIPEHISKYRDRVESNEFGNVRALVIGGSRGLGAAAAKILALGGAEVTITFARGRVDAERVAGEVAAACGRPVGVVNLDLEAAEVAAVREAIAGANTVLYFATPKIRAGATKRLDRDLFEKFYGFYVRKLWELCLLVEELRDRKVVYVPSSTFVESGSKGFMEYSMAKAAAEAMCAEINQSFNFVRTVTTRLPPLKTDQTASLFDLKFGSIFDNLYPVLKTIADRL